MATHYGTTKDGIEQQMGVNHVGHFLLTKLLLPALVSGGTPFLPSRVVNVSSMGNFIYCDPEKPIDFDNLHPTAAEGYQRWTRYGAPLEKTELRGVKAAALLGSKWERDTARRRLPVAGQSKLMNILHATEVNRRCAEAKQPVIAVSLHPGTR